MKSTLKFGAWMALIVLVAILINMGEKEKETASSLADKIKTEQAGMLP